MCIRDRVDFEELNSILEKVLINNGVDLPFYYAVVNKQGQTIFKCKRDFYKTSLNKNNNVYTQRLFPSEDTNSPVYLQITFPTKQNYILNSMNLLLPSILLVLVIFCIFIVAISIIFLSLIHI